MNRLAPGIFRQLVSLKLLIVLILIFSLVAGIRIIDVLGPDKGRRRSVQEKIAIVQQSFDPGMPVSLLVSSSCGASSIRKAASPPMPLVNRLCPRRS